MSRIYKTRLEYIGLLRQCEQARDDFGDLQYWRSANGQEYLILHNIIGNVWFFDITGYSEAQIKHTLALIECGQVPSNLITDKAKRMEIAKHLWK